MMVLVDTSVWIEHFRQGHSHLQVLLHQGEVSCHPFIIGELACGTLGNRQKIISLLQALPQAQTAEHEEIMKFITAHHLYGKGLGYIDIHLMAAASLEQIPLWTLDKKLNSVAQKHGLRYL